MIRIIVEGEVTGEGVWSIAVVEWEFDQSPLLNELSFWFSQNHDSDTIQRFTRT